jgi:hypothetical protein
MKQIDLDIFVFPKIMEDMLINQLLSIRKNSGHSNRIDLSNVDMNVFHMLNDFWFSKIENDYLDHYLSIYNTEEGVGLNSSDETIKGIKEYNKTKWRDVFLLHYNPVNLNSGKKTTHWDFTGLTAVGCLNDDYEGGEIVFPRQNISYRINRGDIIMFPGGLTHPHYVEPVTKGLRDVIVGQSMTLPQDHQVNY